MLHIEGHLNLRFPCTLCDAEPRTRNALVEHCRSQHANPKWPKWPKVAQSGPYGPKWPKVAQSGPGWPKVVLDDPNGPGWPEWPRVAQMASARYICCKIQKPTFFWDALYSNQKPCILVCIFKTARICRETFKYSIFGGKF